MDELFFRRGDDAGNIAAPGPPVSKSPPPSPSPSSALAPPGAASQTLARGSAPDTLEPYPWILNPTIDLLFCCGGIFWLLFGCFLIAGVKPDLASTNPVAFVLMATAVIGLHIIGDTHTPATLWRVYFSKVTRQALGKRVAVLGLIALIPALSIYFIHATSVFWVKLTVVWALQHQLSQSYGIALIYCFKRKVRLSKNEKLIMASMINATIVYLGLRMFTLEPYGHITAPGGLELPFWNFIPEPVTGVALGILQLCVLVFAGMVVRKYVKEKVLFPFPALLTLTTLVLMPFFAGKDFSFVWYWLSSTFFHSSQYLVVTSAFYLKERGLPENVSLWDISKMLKTPVFFKYYFILLGVGFCFSSLIPNFIIEHGADRALLFAAFWVGLNMHHFATDSFIWKLRDPTLQKLLVS